MKRLSSILLTFLLAFGLLAGCNTADEPNKQEPVETPPVEDVQDENGQGDVAFPVTIKDGIGVEVVIEKKPEKIVSLMPSNTEIAYALGLGDEIVGVSEYDNYPEEVLEKETIGGQDFNVEKIISLQPDLVLAHGSSEEGSKDGLQQLRDADITVLVVHNAESFSVVYETIEMIGKATGTNEEAIKVIEDMKDTLAKVEEAAAQVSDDERKTVFVEVAPSPDIFTTGKNTFMDEMIAIVHANNAAGEEEGWVQLTEEAIIALNPDVIITTYGYYIDNPQEEVLNRQGWADVTAVKNEQIVDVHSDKVTRSGPRLAEGVEELAKAIYPELFTE